MALATEEIVAVLLLPPLMLLKVQASQCIFGTGTHYKAPNFTVTESFVINDYYNDCELLCYTNPSRCSAANVVAGDDQTYLCQFVSVVVPSEQISALEANPNGKYIHRFDVVQNLTDVARLDTGATCQNSSSYSYRLVCENVLDGDMKTDWATASEGTGSWIKINLPRPYVITEVVLFRRCVYLTDIVKEARLYYRDGSFDDMRDMSCTLLSSGCPDEDRSRYVVRPVITDFVKIEIIAGCSRFLNPGFKEVNIIALEQ